MTSSWTGAPIPRRIPKQAPPDSTLGRLVQNLAATQPADDVDPTAAVPTGPGVSGAIDTDPTSDGGTGDETSAVDPSSAPTTTSVGLGHSTAIGPERATRTDATTSAPTTGAASTVAGPSTSGSGATTRATSGAVADESPVDSAVVPGPGVPVGGDLPRRASIVTDISEMLSPTGITPSPEVMSLPDPSPVSRAGIAFDGDPADPFGPETSPGTGSHGTPARSRRRSRRSARSAQAFPSTSNRAIGAGSSSTVRRSGRGAFGRFVRTVVVVGLIGGLGYAGATQGPGMYDEYVAKGEPSEPEAPRSFPRGRGGVSRIRTATFLLEGVETEGGDVDADTTYTVTVDFETNLSKVLVDRAVAPDIEILTFSDDALVHRVGSDRWYQIQRGAFPLDGRLQRSDWIRQIDELIPPDRRDGVEIEAATVAEVSGVTTRRLALSIDPTRFEMPDAEMMGMDPIGDIAQAVDPAVPAVEDVETPADAPSEVETTVTDLVTLELWIDGEGVVRRSSGAAALGSPDVTILETSSEPWVPDYPSNDQVLPMTAATLLDLGI